MTGVLSKWHDLGRPEPGEEVKWPRIKCAACYKVKHWRDAIYHKEEDFDKDGNVTICNKWHHCVECEDALTGRTQEEIHEEFIASRITLSRTTHTHNNTRSDAPPTHSVARLVNSVSCLRHQMESRLKKKTKTTPARPPRRRSSVKKPAWQNL